MSTPRHAGSWSLSQPDYWWYGAREQLLAAALGRYLGSPGLVLDVGSADGPSAGWVRARSGRRLCVDIDLGGLQSGSGVCASAEALPFPDAAFDVAVAFDVVEHCADRPLALAELARVLRPGGRLLMSVPAYRWAWTDHDVRAGHHTRYTRPRLVAEVRAAGLEVDRSTYAFTAVFPFFAAERLLRRARAGLGRDTGSSVPQVGAAVDRLLRSLCRIENRVLAHTDLPFGSSVFLAAHRPGPSTG